MNLYLKFLILSPLNAYFRFYSSCYVKTLKLDIPIMLLLLEAGCSEWTEDRIQDFTATDRYELIFSCIAGYASSDISKEMIESSLFKSTQNMKCFPLVLNHFFCFLLLFFFKV